MKQPNWMLRAQREIDRRASFVFDVAASYGQIFDNVKHMQWFARAVALALRDGIE